MHAEVRLKAAFVPVTPFQQNCSILWCEASGRGALVDPGGEIDRVLAAAEKRAVRIEKILVTHGHLDHAGAVAAAAERLGVPIEGPHRDDAFWIEALAEQGRRWGLAECRPFTPDRWLQDGDRVMVGEAELRVIHCPGHTPGHVVFVHAPSRLAVVGDCLFRGSIGRTDLPRGDHRQLLRSIRDKLWPLGEDVQFVPGHGQMSSFGWERKTNPFVSDMALAQELDG
ncbi:MAG: MBL fold metallo-hydrolase [Alphaproteobacteria bacterium]|nr:MBL fold metallo-hydrolase [Alphaproteobacteria bacterium]